MADDASLTKKSHYTLITGTHSVMTVGEWQSLHFVAKQLTMSLPP